MTERWHTLTSESAGQLASTLAVALDLQRGPGPERAPFVPEEHLSVSFEGLTAGEQQVALGSFPGARRFVLAAPSPVP